MGVPRLSWLAFGLASALLAQVGSAVQLQPIDLLEHEERQLVARDSDCTKLDLQKVESFLWGGYSSNNRYALGNFTVFTPGDHESIISMEKFYPLVKSTECTKHSLTMDFEDHKAYEYGAKTWRWVNDEEHHTFLLVAGKGHCGWNEDRLPFIVKNVLFDDRTNRITAVGEASDWVNATHSAELYLGGRPGSKHSKRFLDDETWAFPVAADLPLNHKEFNIGDAKLTYDCSGCGTHGEMDFTFHFVKTWDIPHDVELIIHPNGVEAVFEPVIKLEADLTGQIDETLPLGSIPIGGISIAGGVVDLGPEIVFDLVYGMGPLKGTASITGGGTASLDDSAALTLDLLNPDVSANGWTPQFTAKPITLDAALSGSVMIGLQVGIELAIEALDQGFEVGVKLQPYLGSTFTLMASTGETCPNAQGMHEAISIANSIGVDLIAEAGEKDKTESPFVSTVLASTTWPLDGFCTGFTGGISTPNSTFAPTSYAIPFTSSPTPQKLSSAPPSSFPAPLTSFPTPSSWAWPPGSSPVSSVPTGQPVPPSSSGYVPPPVSSSGYVPPLASSSGYVPPPRSSSVYNPPPPPPPSSITPPPFIPTSLPLPPLPPLPLPSSSSSIVPFVRRKEAARRGSL